MEQLLMVTFLSELLSFFATENKLQSHKRACENKYFCSIIMLSEGTNILEFNYYQKSNKVPFKIYADLECISEKTYECKNNSENSYTTKLSKQILSGFSMSTLFSFRSIKNKLDVYRGKEWMNEFCEFLKRERNERKNNKYNFERKMKLLTEEQQESYENVKIC